MEAQRDPVSLDSARREAFSQFARDAEPRLRIALAAAVGQDLGSDATAEALAYAWEHWERVQGLDNPVGYLYRVGRNWVRPPRRLQLPPVPAGRTPDVEPALPAGLAKLSERQRVAVVLVHGFDWTAREVASFLDVDVPTVSTHVRRGLAKLRRHLKVIGHE